MTSNHPYRSSETKDNDMVEVETNDVSAIIYYQDIDQDGNFFRASNTKEFPGQPGITRYIYHNKKTEDLPYFGRGSSNFDSWLSKSNSTGMYNIGNLYIPSHRIIKIETIVKERKEKVKLQIKKMT